MSLKDAIRAANAEKQSQQAGEAAGETREGGDAGMRESQFSSMPESGLSSMLESQISSLTIKVPRRARLHWLIEAKRQGTSLTAAITEALNARFGTPE